ncbi:regulatory protein RecX [Cohnella abietis]|uniref:Regulatory protein RecX n=1 Tax=Cohnella abietis TaxID=2507935 RepID=A0A3T1D8E1_9BACL|nr:regulatory protein RecX [Cohnella abietis]BBI34357.1 hypothetical protein KCTCHS21_37560 [Cohnella abietis]
MEMSVVGAEVIAIEVHPKKPHMYRVILKLEFDESQDEEMGGIETDLDVVQEGQLTVVWADEVDALIAGAQAAGKSSGAGETLVTIHEDTLVSWRLLKGRRLTAEEYEVLKLDEQKEEAYRSSLMMLERKARTTAELSKALKRKGYAPEVVEGCLQRLQSRRMLDDTAYAKRFTEQRAVGQRKGRMLIKQELMQRGVRREDAEEAIGELDEQIEHNSALALARKKWPNIKGIDRERRQKLMTMLLRRGFSLGIVKTAVQQAILELEEEAVDTDYEEGGLFESEYMED